jgi:hypothetical protein
MALPSEDGAPDWLRDYPQIEASLDRMEEFAERLRAEVVDHYIPHMSHVYDAMAAELPPPSEHFPELVSFLRTHQSSQQNTSDLVYYYGDATGGFATAAATISKEYATTDAFTHARLTDVEKALDGTAVARVAAPAVE